jgi:ParB family chromosome partitioning protein
MSVRGKLAGKTSKLALAGGVKESHPAEQNYYQEGSFYMVETDNILPNPDQPRKFFDEEKLDELAVSIRERGVLQPVLIRTGEDGKVFLVAGERRWRAAKMAGAERIPCVVTKGNPAEIALIENLQRDDLKPVEESEALGRMVEQYGYTHEQLARVIGKARSTISETLALNALPEEIKEECRGTNLYPRRLLLEIAKQKDKRRMLVLFNRAKRSTLKSDEVREITRGQSKTRRRNDETLLMERIVKLSNALDRLELKAMEEAARVQILAELQKLKISIERILE